MIKSQSLKKRYFAKLSTNLIGLILSLVTTAIIPRGLGPKAYGDFNFLTNFFQQLFPFFTFSTSIGFYTKLSQRQNEFGLITFYSRIIGIAIFFITLFIIATQVFGLVNDIWIDQNITYVYMAAVFSVLTWLISSLIQISDAYGITISTEIAKIMQKFLGLILVLLLFYLNELDLTNFFYYHYFISVLLIISLILLINKSGYSFFQKWSLSRNQIKNYFKEFYTYSKPLFFYSLVGVFVGIFDRWILQKYAGSVENGFFSLALKVGALCFLFTSAMTSLITREFSIAYNKNDIKAMSHLFRRYIPMLFSVAAFFSCFISIQAEKIIYIFGGTQFTNATAPMMIMAFYPVYQTYGQLSGSVFYASGQTKLYSNIGLIFMILGLPIAYFAIAPASQLGLNFGANGLAIKFIVLAFISVNVQLFFNTRFLRLYFYKYFFHQFVSIGILLSLSLFSKIIIDKFMFPNELLLTPLILAGLLYGFFVFLLLIYLPIIFGVSKNDVSKVIFRHKSD